MNLKNRLFIVMVLAGATSILSIATAHAEVDTAWVREYPEGTAADIALDGAGNIYITGISSFSSALGNWCTVKYYPNGDTAWVRRLSGYPTSHAGASALELDEGGNVFVTGMLWGMGNYENCNTIKYDPNGNLVHSAAFASSGSDWGSAIALDDSANVYVAGVAGQHYLTIKYDSSMQEQWTQTYPGVGGIAEANGIAVDIAGNVYITGSLYGSGSGQDYATVKYDAGGTELWAKTYNGPGNSQDIAHGLVLDGSGNIYVTGVSYGQGTSADYVTIKYHTNGDTAWVRRYNGPANGFDRASAIALDGSGYILVTGNSDGIATGADYTTIKYHPDGDTMWVRRHNGPVNGTDFARDMAIDVFNSVYVTGYGHGPDSDVDYCTVKYYANGDIAWTQRYNGPEDDDDRAFAIAVAGPDSVCVTGSSAGDIATIKYFPCAPNDALIEITSPDGGESWHGGSSYLITWSSFCFTSDVRIDYSTNGGASFDSVIASSCPNTGDCVWTLPNISCASCRVRVCDAVDCDPADTSDANFTIIPGVPFLSQYGIVTLLLLLTATAVWMIRKRQFATNRNA